MLMLSVGYPNLSLPMLTMYLKIWYSLLIISPLLPSVQPTLNIGQQKTQSSHVCEDLSPQVGQTMG